MRYDYLKETPRWMIALLVVVGLFAIIPIANLIVVGYKNLKLGFSSDLNLTELGQLGDFFGGHTSALCGAQHKADYVDASIMLSHDPLSCANHPSGAAGADFELHIIRASAESRSASQAPDSGEAWSLALEAGPAPVPSWPDRPRRIGASLPDSHGQAKAQ